MMKRLALLILLCTAPLFAQGPIGGATAVPPKPNQFGANLVANPTFATSLASWTANACVTWDGTTTHTADGSGSAKAACTTGGSVNALMQSVAVGTDQEGELVTAWVKTDANFNGTISWSFFDDTHGDGTLLAAQDDAMTQVSVGSTSWVQIGTRIYPNQFLHSGDALFNVRIVIAGQTAGTVWVDDVSVQDEWYPIHNFVTSTQENGYVWTDVAPTERNYAGLGLDINPSPVIGQIAGVAEINPSVGQTLSSVTLTEQIASDAGCTTILGTKTFASPLATQVWSFAPADYGGIPATGTKDYVCAKLTVTSGGALIDSYPAFAVVFEGSTFRAGLNNWFDGLDRWVHKGVAQYVIGAYDRLSGTNRCSVCIWSAGTSCSPNQATAEACYLHDQQGPGPSSIAPASSVLQHGPENIASYNAANFDVIMSDIVGMSTVCPGGGLCTADQLSPWLDALDSQGIAHMQIVNNWYHCLASGEPASPCPAPAFSPTLTAGTGSISAATLSVKISAVDSPEPNGSASYPMPIETALSSATSISLSGAACAGVNCSVSFTTPACITTRQQGVYIYTSTDGTTYTRQYPTYSGQVINSLPYPCSTAVTLSSLATTGIQGVGQTAAISSISRAGTVVTVTLSTPLPLVNVCYTIAGVTDSTDFPNGTYGVAVKSGVQFTYTNAGAATSSSGGTASPAECDSASPTWQSSTTTDSTVWSTIATTMANASHPGGAGFYVADEPLLASLPSVFTIRQTLAPNANGMPLWGTLINGTAANYWRDVLDIIANDPYGFGAAADPDDIAMLPGTTARTCNDYTGTFNTVSAAADCFPQRINAWVDASLRGTYGVRPVWTVLQLFERGAHLAFTYAVTWQQAMEAIIGQLVWNNHSGIMWWGMVSSSGMEQAWFGAHNTQAFYDFLRTDDQVKQLAPIMLQPTQDSPILRAASGSGVGAVGGETVVGGTVVSNILTSVTPATACGAQSLYNQPLTTPEFHPFGPVNFATITDAATGDEYIFANNLCDSTFNVTFTLANIPAGQTQVEALYEGRTLPITSGAFTDTWGAGTAGTLDVHVYVIRAPRTGRIAAATGLTGTPGIELSFNPILQSLRAGNRGSRAASERKIKWGGSEGPLEDRPQSLGAGLPSTPHAEIVASQPRVMLRALEPNLGEQHRPKIEFVRDIFENLHSVAKAPLVVIVGHVRPVAPPENRYGRDQSNGEAVRHAVEEVHVLLKSHGFFEVSDLVEDLPANNYGGREYEVGRHPKLENPSLVRANTFRSELRALQNLKGLTDFGKVRIDHPVFRMAIQQLDLQRQLFGNPDIICILKSNETSRRMAEAKIARGGAAAARLPEVPNGLPKRFRDFWSSVD